LRRVTVDLTGTIPDVAQVTAFLADTRADKRRRVVDELLQSDKFAPHFAVEWSGCSSGAPAAGPRWDRGKFHEFLRDSFAKNAPYDEIVRGLLTASGENHTVGATNFFLRYVEAAARFCRPNFARISRRADSMRRMSQASDGAVHAGKFSPVSRLRS